jgi:RNA polymerase sigma factor (sigma-70 family)
MLPALPPLAISQRDRAAIWRYLPMRLISKIPLPPGVEAEDIVQDGQVALARAAGRYNPDRNVRFVSYAWVSCLKAMQRAARAARSARLARLPADYDPAWPDRDEDDGGPTPDEITERVEALLGALDVQSRLVIIARFGLASEGGAPVTLAALGRVFQLSRERIRQIEKRALELLRQAAGVDSPGTPEPAR